MTSLFGYSAPSAHEEKMEEESNGDGSHPASRGSGKDKATFTSSKCPSGAGLENSCELPFGFMWSPMAAYNDPRNLKGGDEMAVVKCDGNSLPPVLCVSCLAYMNPYAEMDKKSGIWSCPLCGHENVVPTDELYPGSDIMTAMSSSCIEYRQAISKTNADDDEPEKQIGSNGKNSTYNGLQEKEEDYCTYILLVDENLSPKDGQAIAPAVEAIFKEQIANAEDGDAHPKARIGLVVFGKSVSIYQLGFSGLASADVYMPNESDADNTVFDAAVEKRSYLAEIQTGGEFTSLRNSLSSIFGVSVDEEADESASDSIGISSRMAMLSQRKASRLRKKESGADGVSNVTARSPWMKRSEESLSEKPKRCTAEALQCALELADASISNPSRTSRVILFTNGCPNSGTGNVVDPDVASEKLRKRNGKRATHTIVDTDRLQKALEYFDDLGNIAISAGIGIDVFCSGVTELALPAYQAMVEPSDGYCLPLVSLDTPQLKKNLKFVIESTYVARSEDSVSTDDVNFLDGPECILDIRTDSFLTPTQMCGSGEIIPSNASVMVENERAAFEKGLKLAAEKGFKIKNLPSEKAYEISMTRVQMGRVDPLSTVFVLMEVDDTFNHEDEYAFFQFVARYVSPMGDAEITRVLSFKILVAEDINDFLRSLNDEIMSVALAKIAVYRSLHGREETDDTRDMTVAGDVDLQEKLAYAAQLDIDATVQRISGAFRLLDLEKNTRMRSVSKKPISRSETSSLDIAFPPQLKETLNRLYHLRRGPLISPGPMRAMDDRAEQRRLFLRFPVKDCLIMMRPELWSTGSMTISSGWDTMLEFPPETLALWDDSIVAADFHDSMFIWTGANCTAQRYDGIRDKFKAHLLKISENRFPMPELHELSDGDSMGRRFTARLAPSHADPIDNQIVNFPALSELKPDALEQLRSKFKFYDSDSDASFRTWFWSVASASNNSKKAGMSLCE